MLPAFLVVGVLEVVGFEVSFDDVFVSLTFREIGVVVRLFAASLSSAFLLLLVNRSADFGFSISVTFATFALVDFSATLRLLSATLLVFDLFEGCASVSSSPSLDIKVFDFLLSVSFGSDAVFDGGTFCYGRNQF